MLQEIILSRGGRNKRKVEIRDGLARRMKKREQKDEMRKGETGERYKVVGKREGVKKKEKTTRGRKRYR